MRWIQNPYNFRIQNNIFEKIKESSVMPVISVWSKWEGTTETLFFLPFPVDLMYFRLLLSCQPLLLVPFCVVPLLEWTSSTKAAIRNINGTVVQKTNKNYLWNFEFNIVNYRVKCIYDPLGLDLMSIWSLRFQKVQISLPSFQIESKWSVT